MAAAAAGMDEDRALGPKLVDWVGPSQLWEWRRGNARTGVPGAPPRRVQSTVVASERFRSDAARNLINQGHSVFVKMKEMREAAGDPTSLDPKDCLDICNEYRLVLQTCSNALYERFRRDAERGVLPSPDREAEYEELLQMDQVWSLCEIFFVREKHLRKHGGYIVQSLCAWVRQHFSSAQEEARMLLQTGDALPPVGAEAGVYWTVLFQLLFQGETPTVRDLLGLHVDGRDPASPSGLLRGMLDTMPTLGAGDGITEFLRQWKLWQKGCREALQGGALEAGAGGQQVEPEYELMLRLLAGDVGVFDMLKRYADTWCQLLVARLLYTNPLARFFDLQVDVDWARAAMADEPGVPQDPVQELYYHVMNLDPFALIKGSCECFDAWSWWLPVHLIDILIGLRVKFGGHGVALRAYLLREFTEHLTAEPSLFAVVPTYFAASGELGQDHLECFLERVPIDSERKALKLLRLCAIHRLPRLERTVCRVMGARAVAAGQTGSALAWYTRAGDEASIDAVTRLADRLLEDHRRARLRGRAPDLQRRVKTFLPAVRTPSDRMEFLREYCAFLDARQSQRHGEAADALVAILERRAAPKWFWCDLLLDALPLLELPGQVAFDEAGTLTLMRCLEELAVSPHAARLLGAGHAHREAAVEELRLALARNLASAIMCRPQR